MRTVEELEAALKGVLSQEAHPVVVEALEQLRFYQAEAGFWQRAYAGYRAEAIAAIKRAMQDL